MQHNKMCFITCLNDEILYDESVRYINSLHVPDDFEVEIIAIRDAKSLTEGYNRAMRMSDAKYKVYLHQDTLIINKTFINDVVSMFTKYPKLGMMGVIGAEKLPPSGTWWKANVKYGKVFESSREGRLKIFENNEVSGDYQPVEAVDGLILMTQYDINWRDDLFKGWHMYDISQAMEFKKAGYEVGVPIQESCWCIHDCGPLELVGYEKERLIFINEYSSLFQPKVSVLIPAYNRPYYLELALRSALHQSYKNIEIIICDDSTNNEVMEVVQPYLLEYSNVRYYKNPENLALGNWYRLFDLADGEYINYLMDDDLFKFEKIEKMVFHFESDPEVTLVTSYRELIDENGEPLDPIPATRRLSDTDVSMEGQLFASLIMSNMLNLVGEPTTAMFRKKDITKFGHYNDREYCVLNDLATWLTLLKKGKVVYISEALSYFRRHSGQNQKNPKYIVLSINEWLTLIKDTYKDELIASEKEYKQILIRYLSNSLSIIDFYVENNLNEYLQVNDVRNDLEFTLNELIPF